MKRSVGFVALSALMGVLELSAQSNPSVPAQVVTGAATSSSGGSSAVVSVTPSTTPPTVVPTAVVPAPTVVPVPPPPRKGSMAEARLVNLSTRARVTTANPLISGFAISGTAARPVLIRAAGPGLTVFGVTGALATPRLQIRDAVGTLVAENAGWGGSAALANTFATAGAFPFAAGSADAAAVVTLAPGSYTVQVLDASPNNPSTGGVALVEVYDVGNRADDSRLVNVSTRSTVAAGGGELISGFVLAGDSNGTFLLRGVGPGLANFGVSGVLSDPVLTIFNSTGRQVATNDDWGGGTKPSPGVVMAATIGGPASGTSLPTATTNSNLVTVASQATGAFSLGANSFDAALVTTLAPGAYTVQVTGGPTVVLTSGSSTAPVSSPSGTVQAATAGPVTTVTLVPPTPGVALLEIYEVP